MPPISQSYTLPPPTGGLNDRDAVDLMAETDALRMVNLFPGIGAVSLRGGYRSWSTGGGAAVLSAFEYNGQDGTRQMITAANGKVWNATATGAATQIGTGFSVNYWQAVNFGNRLVMVNGTDQPQQWDGTTLSAANYTGVTDNDLIHITNYRNRLYLTEKASASVWYGATNAITGALTEFDVSAYLRKGGYLLWCGSWTRDKGSGASDLFIMCSSQGEVLVYSGSDPGDAAWSIVGHFFLPVPLGRRSFVNMGSELGILTEQGIIPLSQILADSQGTITDKIRNSFREAAKLYKANVGWDVIHHPRSNMLIVNVPVATSSSSMQFVMNTLTGAWCKFTGLNAFCWTLLNEKLYFGGGSGVVFEADYGSNDNGAAIPFELKQAFSYLGDRTRIKQFLMGKPIVMGDSAMRFGFNVDTDYSDRALSNSITTVGTSGSLWDTATWDVSPWDSGSSYQANWYSVNGIGRCVAPRIAASAKNAPFSLSAIQVIYKVGSVL